MKYNSDAVKPFHLKYGSSRYYTTLITLLHDGTRFEWSRNEEGLIYFSWEEGKRVTFFRLMQEFGMDYAIRESFKIVTDYNVWDSSSLLEEAKKLLETKKQFVETPFISYLYDGMKITRSADQKQLKIHWKGLPIEFKYVTDKVLKDLDQQDTNFLTPFLGALVAQYLLELKPADCETDGQNKLTWCAKQLIKNSPATLLLPQYTELTDELAEAFSNSDCQSLYLNGLSQLPLKTAETLSAFKGRLFLDGLNSISKDSLSALLKHTGRYLSMRGLILDPEEIKKTATQYDGFLRVGKKTDTKRADEYTKAELEASILSDKKKFASLSKLLTSDTKEQIDAGLLMFSALSDAPAADALLEGISYFKDENSGVLVLNSRFKTTLKRQPLLNYSLMGVIYHAPVDSKIANRLRAEVDHLQVDLSDLTYLGAFPELRVLELTNSSEDLTSLSGLGECSNLEELRISGCIAVTDIEDISNLPINRFRFQDCYKIRSLAPLQGKNDASGLKELDLRTFSELTNLEGIEFFAELETLYLTENVKLVSASAISKLHKLRDIKSDPNNNYSSIKLNSCVGLDGLILPSMKTINITLGKWAFHPGARFPNIEKIQIECAGMDSLDWVSAFPNVSILSIECADLSDLGGLAQIPQLKELSLENTKVASLDGVAVLKQLEKLSINRNSYIRNTDIFREMMQLQEVEVFNCAELADISGWTALPCFKSDSKSIAFYNLPNLKNLGDLTRFTHIQEAFLRNSFNGSVLRELAKLPALSSVVVEQDAVQVFESGESITFSLKFKGAKSVSLSGTAIRQLTLIDITISDLSGISGLSELEKLTIQQAKSLSSLRGLEELKKLSVLMIEDAPLLDSIEALTYCDKISHITLRGCVKLRDTNAIAHLKELNLLDLRDSTNLAVKPQAYNMNAEQTVSYQEKLLKAMGAKPDGELKKKQSKLKENRTGTVDKKAFSNIKKLLQSRDLSQIDTALQLIASINEESLFDMLLEGTMCAEGKLVPNKIFTGPGPAIPFLNYGLLHVLNQAAGFDNWNKLCASVREWEGSMERQGPLDQFQSLEKLFLTGFKETELAVNLPGLKSLRIYSVALNTDHIAGCTGLTTLQIDTPKLSNEFRGLAKMTKLQELSVDFDIADLTSLQSLRGCSDLKKLSIWGHYSQNHSLPSLSPLSELKSLTQISIKNLDYPGGKEFIALSSLVTMELQNNKILTELHLPEDMQGMEQLKIARFPNLKLIHSPKWPTAGLRISFSELGIEAFPSMPGAVKLNNLYLRECPMLQNLNTISVIKEITHQVSYKTTSLNIEGCNALQDIGGIRQLQIQELVLSTARLPKCGDFPAVRRLVGPNLESLDGVGQFSGLEQLNLYDNRVISDLNALSEVPRLELLSLRRCRQLISLEGVQHCKNLKVLNITDMDKLSDISALEGMMIEQIYIAGSLLKKSDFPAHLQDFIDWQTKPD